jgi:DNA invertase Pin-like site-specific DNA recombinase
MVRLINKFRLFCTFIVRKYLSDKTVLTPHMKIGYARVSSSSQDLELQKQALLQAGCSKIFSESLSGRDNNRPQLMALLDTLRPEDILVVYKIDRIARSLKGLIEVVELLNQKQVNLLSLDAGDRVDTTSPMGKAFFQIAGVFAELERSMIHTRTKAGIEKAKRDGVRFGRVPGSKNKTTLHKTDRIRIFLKAGKSYTWICKELSVSRQTIAKIKYDTG